MKDYTVAVGELRNHYNELTVFKKSVRARVKAEYETKMDFEIQSRIEAEEIKFANHVAAVKERDNLPVSVIQDHVLRTRTWNRWERIRDLAGIPGEFVRAEDAREAKRLENSHFRWSEDYDTVTVVKNSKGDELEAPVIFESNTIHFRNGLLYALSTSDADEVEAIRGDSYKGWTKQLHDELDAQIHAGNITAPTEEN